MMLPKLVKALTALSGSTAVIKKDSLVLLVEYSIEWNELVDSDPEGRELHTLRYTVLDETGRQQKGIKLIQNDELTIESWFEPRA